jgi:nicotinamide-nucleotide amidase
MSSPTTNAWLAWQQDINSCVERLAQLCLQHQLKLTAAESCTGGGIAEAFTRVSGSSKWFEQSWVTYSNAAKQQQLGVTEMDLVNHGAVSEPVVLAMAAGARQRAAADWAVAVSGIAGPDGGTAEKPVGLVWMAWADARGVTTEARVFAGDRAAVRAQTVLHVVSRLTTLIETGRVENPVP